MTARTFGHAMMTLGAVIVLFAFLAMLVSCATTGAPAPEVRIVKETLTVPVSCAPEPVPEPAWATRTLKPGASFDEAQKGLIAEMEQRKAYELRVRAALEACRSLPAP